MGTSTKEERDALDAKVMAAIASGITRAGKIEEAVGADMRAVDRSLQRLRTKGKVRFHSPGGWKAVSR